MEHRRQVHENAREGKPDDPETPWELGPITARPTHDLEPYRFRWIPVPDLDPEDDARLLEWIRFDGVLTPLIILTDGRVINGRGRLRHAKALRLDTVPTRELLTSVTELEIEISTARVALATRHLTEIQKFTMLHALSELEREWREAERRPRGRPRKGGLTTVSANSGKNQKGKRTDALVAQVIGTSADTVFKLRAIKERGSPELFGKVQRQEVSVDAAYRALAPAPAATSPNRMPRALAETLDVEIPKKLWELSRGFKTWPRGDQDRFLDLLGDLHRRMETALERRRPRDR